MILEGCYPYVFGGVSSWTHQYIQAMPDTEFVIWTIGANEKDRGKFKFKLPDNVVEVHEVFLDNALQLTPSKHPSNIKITKEEETELKHLLLSDNVKWDVLFNCFHDKQINPIDLLMSEYFINIVIDICRDKYPYISFAAYFHTVRSMMLPELYLLTLPIPKADIYHSTATGYSGLLGSLAAYENKKPFVVTEHGIYTREREEELLRATWVVPYFRKQWINLFYSFSACAYEYADKVTALFNRANEIQRELGCDVNKLSVIENGIHFERFCDIPPKKPDGYIDIGAVVRIAKIKDIKTMIYAFAEVKMTIPNARLHICGDIDDEEYNKECHQLIEQLNVKDIIFTGVINVVEYMVKLDFTILTSISEGQPLSVLESFAAGRPCVTTDVGCCRELLEDRDGLGVAGLVVPPMNKEKLAAAIVNMCIDETMRNNMAVVARKRAQTRYTHEISMDKYRLLYNELMSK